MNKYLTLSQLKRIGFKKIGKNCKISKSISTYNLIGSLGDNVRIDDYTIISTVMGLKIQHISQYLKISVAKMGNNIACSVKQSLTLALSLPTSARS
mgnify:CR=1 FL=1